jgi:hypothetical protein
MVFVNSRVQIFMMKTSFFLVALFAGIYGAAAQTPADTTYSGGVTVIKDARIDLLGKKMAEYNDDLSLKVHTGKGFRLMVISTNDRDLAMKVRSQLYQLFPDQKQYMSYQVPNIKIKFGNFTDKDEAEKMQKQLVALKIVTNNIYVLPEMVEIKPDKKDPNPAPDN